MAKTAIERYRDTYFNENIPLGLQIVTAQREMLKLCDNTSAKIYRSVQKARSNPNYSAGTVQLKLLSDIDAILKEFRADAILLLNKGITTASNIAVKRIVSDFAALSIANVSLDPKEAAKIIAGISQDSEPYITIQALRMFHSVKQAVKKEAIEISRLAAIEGISRIDATKAMFAKNSNNEIPLYFVNKAGRRSSSGSYFEIVIGSVMKKSETETYIGASIANSHDVVIISDRNSGDARAAWEGKQISLTGITKGLSTFAEMQASSDIFHPRSKHSLLVYMKEADEFLKEPYAISK